MSKIPESADIDKEVREFVEKRKTLILATSSAEGKPTASYAPFVKSGTSFYVFLSTTVPRTGDILETKQVSVLLIADECESKNIFARHRIEMLCRAVMISREYSLYETTLALFRKKFGKIFDEMPKLADFKLFCLTPTGVVRYVKGFGQAYDLYADLTLSTRVTGPGHTPRVEK
ncbi:MAG: pyridoxamine 5'-phosphate oxidase family protein [Parcubacteria group bacterium]|nr:pyridoxamine 5'-phosphate oxidase family protein [Parcubacteria group bacterium]